MSAEVLRRAASEARRRGTAPAALGSDFDDPIHLAVADWLNGAADLEERNQREMGWSPIDISAETTVARAYLGES